MSTIIDDRKKCICNPPLSGKNRKCLRCHPKKKKAVVVRFEKPGQVKKHNALPTRDLPWLREPKTQIDIVEKDDADLN